jgi:putative spermidine/putrescine transport system substrate-binding protein
VTLLEILRQQAEQDLGLRIEYQICDVQDAQRIAVMHPDRYDLYDQWFHNVDFVWPARSIQPLDINRLTYWNEINNLPKLGSLFLGGRLGDGSVPVKRLYVQHDHSLNSHPTERISMLPLTHNADSFAYHQSHLPQELHNAEESWSWLLHPAFFKQVALQDDAAIGGLDAALAVQGAGLLHFSNVGNLTLEEIDSLTSILANLHQQGHFATFWSSQDEACRLIDDPRISIQSLWAPTYFRHHYRQKGYRLATPREGYRAWYGGLSLSRCATGKTLDAAYDYLNWWLSGWPGAVMAKQGYYISNPLRSRSYLSTAEWDYWYAGKAASEDLSDAVGRPSIAKGEIRSGGSYEQRMSHIAVWNSVMDEHNYLVRCWHDFIYHRIKVRP